MVIAIDYDETWSRDPEFWRMVVAAAESRGHTVIGVTWRKADETGDMCAHYQRLSKVYFTGGAAKRRWVESTHGQPVDVWIDDSPEAITRDFVLTNGGILWPQ